MENSMRIIPLVAAAAFALSVASAEAFQRGSGGLSFDCSTGDAEVGQCVCEPPASSTDCQNMKKYCAGDITCGWGVDHCYCKQKPAFRGAILQGKFNKAVVTGGAVTEPGSKPPRRPRNEGGVMSGGGILDPGSGLGTQGPAATGAPLSTGRGSPPPGQIK
jgi:hypothetical protein